MQNVAHQLWRRNDRHDQPFCMTVCQNVRKLVRRPFFWQSSETETGLCISHFKLCSRKKLLKFRDDQNSPLASIRPKHSEGPTLVPSPPSFLLSFIFLSCCREACRRLAYEPCSTASVIQQGIAPVAARRYAPADDSSTVTKIAADLRPFADGSAHLWWPAVAKLQAASVPIA